MIGNRAIHASSSLLAIATAHRYPHRSALIRRSLGSTACPNFCNSAVQELNVSYVIYQYYFTYSFEWDGMMILNDYQIRI